MNQRACHATRRRGATGTGLRRGSVAAVAAVAAIAAAACGAAPGSPAGSATYQSALAFARCMRAHGVADFPDPGSNGQFNSLSGINPNSPKVQAAGRSCQSVLPGGNPAAQLAQGLAQGLRFSRCMRAHGIRNFPDPSGNTAAGGSSISIHVPAGSGIDPNSPQFRAALQACRSILPQTRSSGAGSPGSRSAG